jgi:hypothetical protein
MKELWKPVLGYEHLYEVSNLGRVRSLPREAPLGRWAGTQHVAGQLRSPRTQKTGYQIVSLRQPGGKRRHHLVHRLVLAAFTGPSDLQVNHKDLDKTNNQLDNLEWVSSAANHAHWRAKS